MTYYDDAMRTIIELPDEQLAGLDAVCRAEGVSRAEAIRRAIGVMLERYHAAQAHKAYGLWRARKVDGLAYQRSLRREWER